MSNHTASITTVEKRIDSYENKKANKQTTVDISVEDSDEDHALQKASELEEAVRSVLEEY